MGFNIVNNTGFDLTQLIELAQELLSFSQEKVGWRRPPTLMLDSDPENAENPLGKTAHYNPNTFEIAILVDKRHPKDILRSLSHELVHHFQNERGDFDRDFDTSLGYAQRDPHLRNMEAEAYETGNLCFRDWEDGKKELNESIYYTKPILGGEDMSNDAKKPLKEWKNEEIHARLMKKFGLMKEDVEAGAEQLFHEETTDEQKSDEEEGDGDEEPESIKGAQEEHPLKEDATDDRVAVFREVPKIPEIDVSDISPPPEVLKKFGEKQKGVVGDIEGAIQTVKDFGVGASFGGKGWHGKAQDINRVGPPLSTGVSFTGRYEEQKKNMDKQIIQEQMTGKEGQTIELPKKRSDYEKHMAQQQAQLRQALKNQLVRDIEHKRTHETIFKRNTTGKPVPHPNALRGEKGYWVQPGKLYSYEIPIDPTGAPSTGDWGKGLTPAQQGSREFDEWERDTRGLESAGRSFAQMDWPITSDDPVRMPHYYDKEQDAWYPLEHGWIKKGPWAGKQYHPQPEAFVRAPSGFEVGYPGQTFYGPKSPAKPQESAGEELAWAGAETAAFLAPIPVPKGVFRLFPRLKPLPKGLTPRGQLPPGAPRPYRFTHAVPEKGAPVAPETLRTPLTHSAPGMSPEFAAQPQGAFSWKRKYDPLPETVPPEMKAADDALQAKNISRPHDDQVWERARRDTRREWHRAENAAIAAEEKRLGRELTDEDFAGIRWPERADPTSKEAYAAAYVNLVDDHLAHLAALERGKGFKPSSRLNLLNARAAADAVRAKKPSLFKRIFKRKPSEKATQQQVDDLTGEIAAEMKRDSPYEAPIEHFKPIAREQALESLGIKKGPTEISGGTYTPDVEPTAEVSRLRRIWENSVGFVTGKGVPKAEEGFRGWMRGRWVQKPWYKVPGEKGVKLQSPVPPGAIVRGGILAGGAAAIGEIKDWLAEYIGDSTDQEKLENRLVWMWDTEKEQWMDINREMVLDPKSGHIVGYWTGNKAVFGDKSHDTLLDYNGNPYKYSSLQPPAKPPQKCIDENIKSCLVIWGPANSRQEVAPEGLVEALWYHAFHSAGTGTDIERFGMPSGHIRSDLLEKIKNEENLRGQFTLSPWAAGLRDIMRRPVNKLGEPIGDPVSYGGPITNGLADIDPETMGADYPYGPQSYMVDGSRCPTDEDNPKYKECWAKVPKFLGRGRWDVLQNIPGIGRRVRGEEVEWVMHPYLASKLGVTSKYPYMPAFIGGRPLFSTGLAKEAIGDWFAPREGQSLNTIMKKRFGETKPIMLWRTDIPLAYQLDLFTDEELMPPPAAPNRIIIETEEDKVNNNLIDLTVLYPGGFKEGDDAGEFLNSPFFESFRKDIVVKYVDWVREIKKNNPNTSTEQIIKEHPISDFVDAIRKRKEDRIDPQTGSLRLDTGGAPVDPKRLVRDPNAPIGKQVKPAKPAWQERDLVTIKAIAKDYPEDGIMEFNVDPVLLRTQTTKDGQKCWTKTDEGHYILAGGECITDSLIGPGARDPVAPGPAEAPVPGGTKKELPSPEALRKAAPKRDDIKPSWVN